MRDLDPKGSFLQWPGAISFEKLDPFYRQADAFVFASSCENLPNIMIEAMGAGLPIASARRGPMPEILGAAGIYFDPEDVTSIADALRVLIETPHLREELAQMASLRAQDYSWRRCAEDTLNFIAHVQRLTNSNSERIADV
jgi:glycosyltransferase involved in cell wall biosynthesis